MVDYTPHKLDVKRKEQPRAGRFFTVVGMWDRQPKPRHRNGTMPWIKAHHDHLLSYEMGRLVDGHRFHLLAIELLAARMPGGQLPFDSAWVKKKISASGNVPLDLFLERGLIVLVDPDGRGTEGGRKVDGGWTERDR